MSQNLPDFTVIVPTHHRPQMLRRLLHTLVAQRFDPQRFEVIIVGNAEDQGQEIVTDMMNKTMFSLVFTYIPNDPDQGRNASAKRNHGARLARGSWLAFSDDDCEIDPLWLETMSQHTGQPNVAGLEGEKIIPQQEPPTATYKGLKLMTAPGGYQTFNICYRRAEFLRLGGFDPRLPFYLEDTDWAWTLLDAGFEILYVPGAIVRHPVVPPAPWRLLADAKRSRLLPYLAAKHPMRYISSRIRPLRRSGYAYLVCYLLILLALIVARWDFVTYATLAFLTLTTWHLRRIFAGCVVTGEELLISAMLHPIFPLISVFQFARGCIEHRYLARFW